MSHQTSAEGVRLVGGRYRLLSPLGSGGMGTVWRAHDEVLGREVAVKELILPPSVTDAEHEVLRERTRREARLAARLDHPSAVTVFDVVEEDGHPFLVMELVEARTLSAVIREDGPLAPGRVAAIGLALLGALEAAHAEGIVHRDVKPGNVLVRPDGRVVLTDFGIATSTGDSSLTHTGLLLGSPSYIAPERATGGNPEPASDLWSLGATLFTAVEGRPPFGGTDVLTTVTAVVTGVHAPFVAAGPLSEVLEGLLVKDPALRLDAATAARLLQAVAADPANGATVAAPTSTLAESATLAAPASLTAAATAATSAAEGRAGEHTTALPVLARVRQGGRRRPVLAVLAVAAVLAAGGVGYLATHTNGGGTVTAKSSTAPGITDEYAGVVVPADWTTYTEPGAGWSIKVPASWTITDRGGLRQFRDEANRRTLRVDYQAVASPDPVGAWNSLEATFRARYPSYSQVRIDPATFRGKKGADWEFTYTDASADLHVLDRGFIDGGHGYALYWQGRAEDWAASQQVFRQLAASFKSNATV